MKKIYQKSILALLLLYGVQLYAQIPTVEAPKPEYAAADVKSLYSNEYTPITTLSVLPWGQTSILNYVKVGSGEAMQLINLQWLPIGLFDNTNVSTMQYLHIDVYCKEVSPFRLGFVTWGVAGNPNTEVYTPYMTLVPGQWYSIDYPMTYFKDRDISGQILGALRFGDDDGTVYSKEIYVDNIYFFNGTPKNLYEADQPPAQAAPIPTRASANVKSIYSDTYTTLNNTKLADLPWGQTTITGFVTLFGNDNMIKLTNFDWVPISLDPQLDISDMDSIHIDAYLSNQTSQINLGLYTYPNAVTGTPEISSYSSYWAQSQSGKWVSIDMSLKEFNDQGQNCKNINVLRFRGSSEVFIDNIYAYKRSVTGISDVKNDDSFKIYPTKVVNVLNLESLENIKIINIFNTTGQSVGSFSVNAEKATVNLSTLNPGSYIVTTQFSSGKTLSKRIIKL